MSNRPLDTVARLRLGDAAALEVFFDRYKRRLHYFAKNMIKNNSVEAEDIVLDSFVKLWQNREKFECEESIKAFLYISTKNACLSYLNSVYARQHFETEIGEDLLVADPECHAKIIRAEMLEFISREIEKLPETQRKIIALSHYEGKSPSEISAALNMSQSTVYVNYSRGLSTLKKAFKKKRDWFFSFLL